MTHDAQRALVVDLALGLLSPGEARAAEAHAAGCAECAAALAGLRSTRAAAAALPPLPAPARGEAVLLAAARAAADAQRERAPRFLPRWAWGAAFGAVGAAAALLVAVRLAPGGPEARLAEAPVALGGAPATVAAPAPAEAAAPDRRAPPTLGPAPAAAPARPREEAPSLAAAAERVEPLRKRGPEAKVEAGPAGSPPAAPAAAVAGATADLALAEREGAAQGAPAGEVRALELRADRAAPPPAASPPAAVAAGAPARASSAQAKVQSKALAAEPAPADCPGERTRRLQRDGAGRLVGRVREGEVGGVAYRAEERYDEAGRLTGATLRLGRREVLLGPAELGAPPLEPYPGLPLAATAAEAERAPPRCVP